MINKISDTGFKISYLILCSTNALLDILLLGFLYSIFDYVKLKFIFYNQYKIRRKE